MFGSLISTALKTVTLPIDIVNTVADKATGGTGSKRSRTNDGTAIGDIEQTRDEIADSFKALDDL